MRVDHAACSAEIRALRAEVRRRGVAIAALRLILGALGVTLPATIRGIVRMAEELTAAGRPPRSGYPGGVWLFTHRDGQKKRKKP